MNSIQDPIDAGTLSPLLTTRWAARNILYQDTVDSTNRWARDAARNGAPHGTFVLCNVQTAGRGRMQRTWQSHAGEGLLMSLIVRPKNLPPEKAPALVLLGALAVAQALEELGVSCRIKWPNDIVCGPKKVCGMLLEMGLDGPKVGYAVLGVGINVHAHPVSEETAHATSVCEQLGRDVPRAQVAAAFLRHYETLFDAWEQQGMEAILPGYCRRCITLQGRIRAVGMDGSAQEGVGAGICEDGALIMRLDDGNEVTLHAGDVSVRGVMGYV